jgi:putative lipase involved disintegration of autophagic bodies
LSSNPIDFLTDIDVIMVKTNLCGSANTHDGCSVHDGFYGAAIAVLSVVTANVKSALAANPSYQIVCTGHSLGGAIAALLATMLRNQGYHIDLVSINTLLTDLN